MSTISYLRLDKNWDPIWDPDAALTDLDAVAQIIKTTILLFQGEWWEDLNNGTPMFQEIIGSPASINGQKIMSSALSARIAGVPFVSAVGNVNISFNPINRLLTYSATVQTTFGMTTVTVTPGQLAGLEG
jgi:hypothetical protein